MRNDALLNPVLESLDRSSTCVEIARDAAYSHYHFQRAFRRAMGETPGSFRRRMRLERAAWQLVRTTNSIGEIAIDAQYGSLEAFSRSFHRSFGVAPSLYRRIASGDYRLPAQNGVHFAPSVAPGPGGNTMDVLDRLLEHDERLARLILGKLKELPDAALDKPFGQEFQLLCYEPPQRTLRELFHSLLFDKEVWLSVLKGWPFPEKPSATAEGLQERLDKTYPAFRELANEIRREGRWDDTFVDALCSPPETFPYGGMFSFVVFCGSHRLQLLVGQLRAHGVNIDFGEAYGHLMAMPAAV